MHRALRELLLADEGPVFAESRQPLCPEGEHPHQAVLDLQGRKVSIFLRAAAAHADGIEEAPVRREMQQPVIAPVHGDIAVRGGIQVIERQQGLLPRLQRDQLDRTDVRQQGIRRHLVRHRDDSLRSLGRTGRQQEAQQYDGFRLHIQFLNYQT